MKTKKILLNLFNFCKNTKGFASILPLLIIALAAVSTTSPLLTESVLKDTPFGSRIASNETISRIAQSADNWPENEYECSTDKRSIKFKQTGNVVQSCSSSQVCNKVGGALQCQGTNSYCDSLTFYQCARDSLCRINRTLSEGACKPKDGLTVSCGQIYGDDAFCYSNELCYRISSGNTVGYTCLSPGFLRDGQGYCDGDNTKCRSGLFCDSNTNFCRACVPGANCNPSNTNPGADTPAPPVDTGTPQNPGSTNPGDTSPGLPDGSSCYPGQCKEGSTCTPLPLSQDGSGICVKNTSAPDQSGTQPPNTGGNSPAGGNPPAANQPAAPQTGPISGTVNILGSEATSVTVTIGSEAAEVTKTSGKVFTYKSTNEVSAGTHTITAEATLTTGDKLTKTTSASAGSTAADITISAYTTDIIIEKCGTSSVDDTTLNGFKYTACLGSNPTTLAEADQGKFNYSEAIKTKDAGNPYCGQTGYDVYACKDGSIETIQVGTGICNALPWCPANGSTAPAPDPCAPGSDRPEACVCTPSNPSAARGSQDQCANGLLCSANKVPGTGYACCPDGERFCPSTAACVSESAPCAPGIATPTPLPTQYQLAAGCPDTNPDGTVNICASVASGNPTDGLRRNAPAYSSSKTYVRKSNGDAACADFYASTNPVRKYCWTETGTTSNTNPGNGNTGGANPGNNAVAGRDGTTCTTDADCKVGYPATVADNRVCNSTWTNSAGSTGATKACCNFPNRWCTLTNSCISSASQCVAPSSNNNTGGGGNNNYACSGAPGSFTNHCYNGDSDCCTGYKCTAPGGSATAQCVPKSPSDSSSACAASSGLTCTQSSACPVGDTVKYPDANYATATDTCRQALGTSTAVCCRTKPNTSTGGAGNPPASNQTPAWPVPESAGICPDTYYACTTPNNCGSGGMSPRPADNAACGSYKSGTVCCLDNKVIDTSKVASSGLSSIASLEDQTCSTSRDCSSKNIGNTCVFFGNSEAGICRTY